MIKLKGRYIGPNKIKESVLVKRQTYFGKPVYEVTFINGVKKEYPEEVLDYLATSKATDLTELQETTVKPVAEKILAILTEAELTLVDATYLLTVVAPNSVEMNVNTVYRNMWGKETYEVTLRDLNDNLSKGNGK